jgi:hypothetical protein
MHEMLGTMTLAQVDEGVIPIVIFGVGGVIAITAIVFNTVKGMVNSANREKSRREVAAYVAEGSITPEDAERILNAGRDGRSCGRN